MEPTTEDREYFTQWHATMDRLNRDPGADEVREMLHRAVAVALWHVANSLGNYLAESREEKTQGGDLFEAVSTWPLEVATELYPDAFRLGGDYLDTDALERLFVVLRDELASRRRWE
jgi:hypothetical protein